MISISELKEKLKDYYNGEEFYKKLCLEIKNAGLKKGYFQEKIGKPSNWLIRRKDTPPSPAELLIIEQEFGFDILKLIEKPFQKTSISYEKDKEIIINKQKINLSAIHTKVMVILSHDGLERSFLLDTINICYDNIQKKKLKESKIRSKI